MKKNVLLCLIVGVLVLALGTATAFAAEPGQRNRFLDTNKDGVCDRAQTQSLCDHPYFMDENNDGICDNCSTAGACLQDGTCLTANQGGGLCKNNYCRANSDGSCDNLCTQAAHQHRERHCGSNK